MTKRVCFSCVCGKCILRAEAIDLLSKHIWQDWNIKKNWEKFSNILKYRDVSFMQATKQRKKMRHFKKQAWISFLSAKQDIIQPKICHKTDWPQQAECYSNTFFWMKIDFEGRDNEIDMT